MLAFISERSTQEISGIYPLDKDSSNHGTNPPTVLQIITYFLYCHTPLNTPRIWLSPFAIYGTSATIWIILPLRYGWKTLCRIYSLHTICLMKFLRKQTLTVVYWYYRYSLNLCVKPISCRKSDLRVFLLVLELDLPLW